MIIIEYALQHLHCDKATKCLERDDATYKNTDLSGDAFYNNSGYRCDGAPLRVIERALWMIQAGQGSDLFLGQSWLVGRLKEG